MPRLYRDAAQLGWQHITDAERTRQYAVWLDDADVGSTLTELLGREGARLWMKDGPLKEYARALAGAGPYARYAEQRRPGEEPVIHAALGVDWVPVANSFGIKPLHCLAERGDERSYLAWGPARDFKHLLWACLRALDAGVALTAKIVVLESLEDPTPSAIRRAHQRIARRCDLQVGHLDIGLGPKDTDATSDSAGT